MKKFYLMIAATVMLAAIACQNTEGNKPSVKKQEAPVGCRSLFDVYGPVKTLQYILPNGNLSDIREFDEQGKELTMLKNDKEYLELNEMPESETTIIFDEEGKLSSYGIEGYNTLQYDSIYVTEIMVHPTDLGPAYSPEYYVYDDEGNRLAKFFAKFEPNFSEDFQNAIKDQPYLLYCDPNVLNTVVERYKIQKWDDHGNWIERTVYEYRQSDNQGKPSVKNEKRIITYYE